MIYYQNTREGVIEDIEKMINDANIIELYKFRKAMILAKEETMYINDYIDKHWNEYSDGFKKDLNHEIRKFWLKTGPGCKEEGYLIESRENEYPEHWIDIEIDGEDADIWIMEQGTSFNPVDIAQALCDIYNGKITFYKNNGKLIN